MQHQHPLARGRPSFPRRTKKAATAERLGVFPRDLCQYMRRELALKGERRHQRHRGLRDAQLRLQKVCISIGPPLYLCAPTHVHATRACALGAQPTALACPRCAHRCSGAPLMDWRAIVVLMCCLCPCAAHVDTTSPHRCDTTSCSPTSKAHMATSFTSRMIAVPSAIEPTETASR